MQPVIHPLSPQKPLLSGQVLDLVWLRVLRDPSNRLGQNVDSTAPKTPTLPLHPGQTLLVQKCSEDSSGIRILPPISFEHRSAVRSTLESFTNCRLGSYTPIELLHNEYELLAKASHETCLPSTVHRFVLIPNQTWTQWDSASDSAFHVQYGHCYCKTQSNVVERSQWTVQHDDYAKEERTTTQISPNSLVLFELDPNSETYIAVEKQAQAMGCRLEQCERRYHGPDAEAVPVAKSATTTINGLSNVLLNTEEQVGRSVSAKMQKMFKNISVSLTRLQQDFQGAITDRVAPFADQSLPRLHASFILEESKNHPEWHAFLKTSLCHAFESHVRQNFFTSASHLLTATFNLTCVEKLCLNANNPTASALDFLSLTGLTSDAREQPQRLATAGRRSFENLDWLPLCLYSYVQGQMVELKISDWMADADGRSMFYPKKAPRTHDKSKQTTKNKLESVLLKNLNSMHTWYFYLGWISLWSTLSCVERTVLIHSINELAWCAPEWQVMDTDVLHRMDVDGIGGGGGNNATFQQLAQLKCAIFELEGRDPSCDSSESLKQLAAAAQTVLYYRDHCVRLT